MNYRRQGGPANFEAPKGFEVRPTPDLIKQAVFNSLGPRVMMPASGIIRGTGALSLECLSRGAISAVCGKIATLCAPSCDRTCRAPVSLRRRCGCECRTYSQPSLSSPRARTLDLVLADPPYGEKNTTSDQLFAQQVLDNTQLPLLLAPGGLLVLGHSKRDTLTVPSWWLAVKLLKHGDSLMRFLSATQPAT
jgi:16S rRNA G966 N2-methylase RsmD